MLEFDKLFSYVKKCLNISIIINISPRKKNKKQIRLLRGHHYNMEVLLC